MHDGGGAWHFVTLPIDQANEIDELAVLTSRGFGSVRVTVTIGETTWSTRLFPSPKPSRSCCRSRSRSGLLACATW